MTAHQISAFLRFKGQFLAVQLHHPRFLSGSLFIAGLTVFRTVITWLTKNWERRQDTIAYDYFYGSGQLILILILNGQPSPKKAPAAPSFFFRGVFLLLTNVGHFDFFFCLFPGFSFVLSLFPSLTPTYFLQEKLISFRYFFSPSFLPFFILLLLVWAGRQEAEACPTYRTDSFS